MSEVGIVLDYYINTYCVRQNFTKETIKTKRSRLRRFLKDTAVEKFIEIDNAIFDKWVAKFKRRRLCVRTQNSEVSSTLLPFLKYAQKKGFIVPLDVTEISMPENPPVERPWFTEEEVWRMLKIASSRDFALIALDFYGGLRRFEIAKVHRNDIRDDELEVFGKGRKTRYVTLPRCIFDNIKLLAKSSRNGYLFWTKKRKCGYICCSTVDRRLKSVAKRAGIDHVKVHQLRYSFATELYNRGTPIMSIQKLLGHADLRTTQMYVQSEKKKMFEDYNKAFSTSALTFVEEFAIMGSENDGRRGEIAN
jgi:integrase/recombinase XerD